MVPAGGTQKSHGLCVFRWKPCAPPCCHSQFSFGLKFMEKVKVSQQVRSHTVKPLLSTRSFKHKERECIFLLRTQNMPLLLGKTFLSSFLSEYVINCRIIKLNSASLLVCKNTVSQITLAAEAGRRCLLHFSSPTCKALVVKAGIYPHYAFALVQCSQWRQHILRNRLGICRGSFWLS